MATQKDLTSQTVTLLFLTPADSRRVNLRHQDVRQVGVYKGGYLTNPGDGANVTLSPLVAEISDGTYQVRVETTVDTTGIQPNSGQCIVLRWTYTGSATVDLVEVVTTATPLANDVVIAATSGTGPIAFDYGDTDYPRTQPNTLDLHLKVEPPDVNGTNQLKPRIRAGTIQTLSGYVDIADQTGPAVTVPGVAEKSQVTLIYVTASGGISTVLGIAADTGSELPPNYTGKNVLAEITVPYGTTAITAAMIKDVRQFINSLPVLDEDTLISDSAAALATQQSIKAYIDALFVVDQTANVTPVSLAIIDTWYEVAKITAFACGGKDVLINGMACCASGSGNGYYEMRLLIGGVEKVRTKDQNSDLPFSQLTLTWLEKSCAGTVDLVIQVRPTHSSSLQTFNSATQPAVINVVRFPTSS